MFSSRTFLSVPKILLSILTHCTYSEDVIGLLGDINAKTGKLLDYVETDKSLLTIFDLQDDDEAPALTIVS
jgi:hypothetical protein